MQNSTTPELNTTPTPSAAVSSSTSTGSKPAQGMDFKKLLLIVVGLLFLAAVGVAGGYYYGMQQSPSSYMPISPERPEMLPDDSLEEQTVCTMDAMICPDGSSVGRSGPNCEFAPCPGDSDASESGSVDDQQLLLIDNPAGTVLDTELDTPLDETMIAE